MRFRVVCLLLLTVSSSVVMGGDTWPQWRGPGRDCQVTPRPWPTALEEGTLKQTMRVDLGDSYSGPIVTENMIFVTETVGKKEVVQALDRATGKQIWSTEWKGSMTVPFFAAANGSWIRSTPAFADGRLFVASMEDVMVGIDAATGKQLWTKDFREEFSTGNQSFGFACSPLVDGDAVYVQAAAGLIKCDCATGKTIWRGLTEGGGMMGGAFSSPVIATVAGRRQLVVQTRKSLTGVSLEDGKALWSVDIPAFRGMNILTPTVIGDRIFTSSYGGGSFMYEVSANADAFEAKQIWTAKTEAYMSSPVVVDGFIYCHLRNQRVVCLDPENGKAKWTTRPYGKYWSMVANGRKSLVLDERGELILLDLNPGEFRQLGKLKVSEESAWAHLAVVDNQIFVRDLKGLTVYEWAAGQTTAALRR
ncbi:MAG: PQQ-like beta-propeller repeat protein [Planctomycetaceae bacterium]|nr:PQQ-like beta-propeller repeat protein [Planctomycetaceae bacterium]